MKISKQSCWLLHLGLHIYPSLSLKYTSGEFYGLMDICGKGASFLGTTLVAFVSQVTAGMEVNIFGITLQNENLAVGSLIVLFIIGFILFDRADKLNKARAC